MPFAFIFLVFVFLEIAGFVAMANSIGLLGVFALIVAGMLAGGLVIRTIGLASVARMQERAHMGETVGQEMGGLVLGFLGGVLLIVPGFLTDMIGILFLIKPIQMLIWPRYGRQMAGRMPPMDGGTVWRSPGRSSTGSTRRPEAASTGRHANEGAASSKPHRPVVIDAEPVEPDPQNEPSEQSGESQTRAGRADPRQPNPWGNG